MPTMTAGSLLREKPISVLLSSNTPELSLGAVDWPTRTPSESDILTEGLEVVVM